MTKGTLPMSDPNLVILYEVYPQLDAFGVAGVARLLGSFAGIEDEANRVADAAFEGYGRAVGEGDMGDLADSAQDEGIAYYQTLAELKQGVTNLLAVGLYHLFEQHLRRIEGLLSESGRPVPCKESIASWHTIDELRLLANAVKHADGGSAVELRKLRPDYFVNPVIRGSPLAKHALGRRIANPLAGTDLFVTALDLSRYRDALRSYWESYREHV